MINTMNTLTIIFGIVGVAGAAFTIFAFYLRDRKKLVTYQISSGLSLVSVLPDRIGYKITVTYEKDGGEPIQISGAYLRYVRIANLGREPVTKADLVDSDPLRIEVAGGALLDLAVVETTRPVINFRLAGNLAPPLVSSTTQGTSLAFDFLDYRDGALIRVLTENQESAVDVKGTVIGMPRGITSKEPRLIQGDWKYSMIMGVLAPLPFWVAVEFLFLRPHRLSLLSHGFLPGFGFLLLLPLLAAWSFFVAFYLSDSDRKWPSSLRRHQLKWQG
jgi:hypothetical protein